MLKNNYWQLELELHLEDNKFATLFFSKITPKKLQGGTTEGSQDSRIPTVHLTRLVTAQEKLISLVFFWQGYVPKPQSSNSR